MSKRVFGLIASSLIFAAGIGGYCVKMMKAVQPGDVYSNQGEAPNTPSEDQEKMLAVDSNGLSKATAVIQTTRGKIKFKFYTNDAPKTVHRIVELIQKGFYNGLIFHRVVPGFVIQGGDPTGSGTGGSGTNLQAEFNTRKHVPGTVAMARAADPNSADSQFYISLGTHLDLDGQYTVFGQVTEGQEVANQIQVGDRMTSFTIEP
ncbi:MAG: peptidylprolyl isomerase [Bdellovibrionales bacterium]|nr:peptidylprolyl isomerase [Bdellovibrionales bacterium]